MDRPDWLTSTIEYLQSAPSQSELTAKELAQYIHQALLIAEAEKYATAESRFIFGVRGATAEEIAEIWRNLTPFERSIVVIKNG